MGFLDYLSQQAIGIRAALGSRPHLVRFGGIPDGRRVEDAAMTAASPNVSSATGGFATKHVGRMAVVAGAGASGTLLITTIASVSSSNAAVLSNSASTSVSGAIMAWGTDNSDAFDAALASCEAGGNSLYIDGGLYMCSRTVSFQGNFRAYGPCPRIDKPHTQQTSGRYACIMSTANPAVEINPYAGVKVEDVHVNCLGTNQEIELWDYAHYPGQIGVWAGNTTKPLAVAPPDNYGYAGSGGFFCNGLNVSGATGWGVYLYKCWGQSEFKNLQIYNCGTVPSGGDSNHYGGLNLASECADLFFSKVHIIGVAAGYSGPLNMGTGIKIGGKTGELSALSRFYIGSTHTKLDAVTIEGKGVVMVHDYCSFASKWTNCHFGGAQWQRIEIGESSTVSFLNNESTWVGCSSFQLQHLYIRSQRVQILGWQAEGTTKLRVHYNYPGLTCTGTNLELYPEQDDGSTPTPSNFPNRIFASWPIAISDQPAFPYSLIPDYSGGGWTIGALPTVMVNANKIRVAQNQIVQYTRSGLTPNAVHTMAFRHEVAFDSDLFDNAISIVDPVTSATPFITRIGPSGLAVAGTVTWVMFQFIAPASGQITITINNTNFNQCEFSTIGLFQGALNEVYVAGYLIFADVANATSTGAITGVNVQGWSHQQIWGDVMARKADSTGAFLLSRLPATQVGAGFNARYDGTNWRFGADGTNNGGGAILCSIANTGMQFYVLPTSGSNPATISAFAMGAALKMLMQASNTAFTGTPSTATSISQQKTGAISAGNISYRFEHQADNQGWVLYTFDGNPANNREVIRVDYLANTMYFNGIEITKAMLYPSGITSGMFPRFTGPNSLVASKVDMADATNVKFTGVVSGRPVKGNGTGELISGKVVLSASNEVDVSGLVDLDVLIRNGGAVGSIDTNTISSRLLSNGAFIAGIKTALSHDHNYTAAPPSTTGGANW